MPLARAKRGRCGKWVPPLRGWIMAGMPTLAELLVPRTADERYEQMRALLNSAAFPVSDWYVGSVGRTIIQTVATVLQDLDVLVPQIAASGFIGPLPVGDQTLPARRWLELLARELYGITPAPATYTRQRIALWCLPGNGPYSIEPGQLTVRSRDGNRYANIDGGTVPAGGAAIVFTFQAELPGAHYNADTVGRIVDLVTPLPGLMVCNDAPDFGGLDAAGRAPRSGAGTGTVTPQRATGAAPAGVRVFSLTITRAGQVGTAVATLTSRSPAGTSVVGLSPIRPTIGVGNGITLAFADGGLSPSFVVGDTYTFSTPGSPIVNAGTDPERNDLLRARMRGRWPSLGAVPTADKYTGWVRQASIDAGYGVTKITAEPSLLVAGQVEIRVATDAGAVPGDVVAALQVYVDQRLGIGDRANVASMVDRPVTAGGTVIVRARNAAAVKAAAKVNWEAHLADLPDGAVVRLAELQQAIMDAGAVDVAGLTLNSVAGNIPLALGEVAVAGNALDTALTWPEVP